MGDRLNKDKNREDRYRLGLCDARRQGRLTELPNGILFGSLAAAAAQRPELLPPAISGCLPDGGGSFIYVPAGVVADKPLFVEDACGCGENGEGAENKEGGEVVVIGDNAAAKIYYRTAFPGGKPCAIDKKRRIFIGDGARYAQYELLDNGAEVSVHSETAVSQMGNALSEFVTVKTGDGYARLKHTGDLDREESEMRCSLLYIMDGEEKADIDVTMNHNLPKCRSDVFVKGLAAGKSAGTFTGLVYVARDAQLTEAYQQARSLLLSDTARILASPQLEIYADDVKCSHGATVGYQDGDEVYYMRQRGLSEGQARELLLAGFVDEIVMRIPEGEYRDAVAASVREKINRL